MSIRDDLVLQVSVLKTTMLPSNIGQKTASIVGEKCLEIFLKSSPRVCPDLKRYNSLFTVFLIFKGLSILFNTVALYAGVALIIKYVDSKPITFVDDQKLN